MMKKEYNSPAIEIKMFEVEDVITVSVATDESGIYCVGYDEIFGAGE